MEELRHKAKLLLLMLLILSFSFSEPIAQGFVRFYADAPVTFPDGTGPGARSIAGLYLVKEGNISLLATTRFRTDMPGVASLMDPIFVRVPGVPPGFSATFRVRV